MQSASSYSRYPIGPHLPLSSDLWVATFPQGLQRCMWRLGLLGLSGLLGHLPPALLPFGTFVTKSLSASLRRTTKTI